MKDSVLVVDAGGGGIRASVYTASGDRLAIAERRWSATLVPSLAPFGKQYDLERATAALEGAVRDALEQVDPARIAAIVPTGQRIGCAFIGDGQTLYLGPNGDVRGLADPTLELPDADAVYARTGRPIPWLFAPARLAWFARCEPALFERIERVTGLPGWVGFHLTGRHRSDRSVATDLLLWDVVHQRRSVPHAPGSDDLWPSIAACTDVLGPLRPELASQWTLAADTVVAVGMADTQAAAVGLVGDVLVAGSSAPLLRLVTAPLLDPDRRVWLGPCGEGWMLEANLGEMGTVRRWLLQLFALRDEAEFDQLAAAAPPGARNTSSHLGPRAMDLRSLNPSRPAAILMPFGETTHQSPPSRAEVLRSFVENCAFAVRDGRERLDLLAPAPHTLTVVGGAAGSTFFCDVLASVLQLEVRRGAPDATARGAAACGLVSAGLETKLERALEALRATTTAHFPSDDYDDDDAYDLWSEREEMLEQ